MSVEAMALVLHHSTAVGTAKVVLIGIANHEGDGGSWPSIATLAKYANMDERSVQRSIERLVQAGELRREIQAGGTHDTRKDRRPNRYEVTVTCPPECDGTKNHRVTRTSPRSLNGVTPTSSRGDTGVGNGVTLASPEPSLNHPGTKPSVARGETADGTLLGCASHRDRRRTSCDACLRVLPPRKDTVRPSGPPPTQALRTALRGSQ